MEKLKIEEIHQILLGIAEQVHKILVEADIKYYMIAGTMLGAVRHKGFIPWDDDMDFGIFRKDFEKAKAILKENLPPRYRVRTMMDCDGIVNEIVKIEDTSTIIEEYGKSKIHEKIGVNIDLFPLDFAQNKKKSWLSRNSLIYIVTRLNKARLMPDSRITKMLFYIIKPLLCFTRRDFLIRVKRSLFPKSGEYIVNYYGIYGMGEYVHCSIYGNGKEYDFDKLSLNGVCLADEYLKSLYGDYMKLPPEEKRHLHIYNAYKK